MIDGLVAGRLMGDASRRVDKTGRTFIVARVLARNKADEEFIVNVIAFDAGAGAALLALGDGDALSLSTREREATLAQHRRVGVGQPHDEIMGTGEACGTFDLLR